MHGWTGRRAGPVGNMTEGAGACHSRKIVCYCFEQDLVDQEKYHSFSNERRESVLKFPEEYRRKLSFYQAHWQALVYPFNVRKSLERMLRGTFIWKYLRAAKRLVTRYRVAAAPAATAPPDQPERTSHTP